LDPALRDEELSSILFHGPTLGESKAPREPDAERSELGVS
jgi:hypothetical protein